jgi:hypothetical protein
MLRGQNARELDRLRATVCARTDVEDQALLSPTKRHILDLLGLERENSIPEAMDHQ